MIGVFAWFLAHGLLLDLPANRDLSIGPDDTVFSSMFGWRNSALEQAYRTGKVVMPASMYAAFGTNPGCGALKFKGTSAVDSYDSTALVGGVPDISKSDGNVGTNGNLTESGTADIYGTLSTPRIGVGACSDGNVDAYSSSGGAKLHGAILPLPQAVSLPTPNIPLSKIPECQKYLDEGSHRRLYTWSESDYQEISGIWSNDEVALPDDPPGELEVVEGMPDGGKIHQLVGVPSAFTPDYAPEEFFEIASKLYKASR